MLENEAKRACHVPNCEICGHDLGNSMDLRAFEDILAAPLTYMDTDKMHIKERVRSGTHLRES